LVPVYQTKFWDGRPGSGNCLAASLASILNINIDEVPELNSSPFNWRARINDFLSKFNLFILPLPYIAYKDIVKGFHLIIGKTGFKFTYQEKIYDLTHCVVGLDGQVHFDPMPLNIKKKIVSNFQPFSIELLVNKY
jgi:hypothetical protein